MCNLNRQEEKLEKILVIKLGALGDFVQAMGAFKAIREHHKDSEITLMTTTPFEGMGRDCGYFDQIWIDHRKPFWNLKSLWDIRREFRSRQFNRVYDLQCVGRTNTYYKYLLPSSKPQWSGTAVGCSHPHSSFDRKDLHTYDRHRKQLKMAGMADVPDPTLEWVQSDASRFKLPEEYVLLIPGAAPGGKRKQWPAQSYGEIAAHLVEKGITPVIIGGKNEKSVAKIIQSACPEAIDLTGETSFYDIVELARHARGALGNDTGPTHMVAQTGCKLLVLFSNHSDPALFGPRGKKVKILQRNDLSDLSAPAVWQEARQKFTR